MKLTTQNFGQKRRSGYAMALLALLTCPCHLPVLALLLSGSAAGGFLTEHFGVVLALLSLLFALFLVSALRLLRKRE
jgi:mercuric ion transport protein